MHNTQGPIMTTSIEKYMVTEVVSFAPDDDIIHAMRVLLEAHLSGGPVLDSDGQMVGVLSQKDCLAIVYNTAYHQDWGGFPVLRDGQLIGQISRHDIMRALDETYLRDVR
jgi:CBS domain-containing protein